MFKSFTNYVEERKKSSETGLVGKPKVKLVADYDGPDAKKPPKGSSETPYKTPVGDDDPNKGKNKDGMATLGDKKLVYEPDTKPGSSKLTTSGKELPSPWAKNGTKALKESKEIKNNLVQYMRKLTEDTSLPTVTAFESGNFRPNPNEAIRYVVALSNKSPKVLENFIYDAKRTGILGNLLETILDHPEAYMYLGQLLSDEKGTTRSKNLARALHQLEQVGPQMGMNNDDDMGNDFHDEGDGEEDEENMDDMDGEEDDDMEEHPEEGDFEDEEGDDEGDEEEDWDDDDEGEDSGYHAPMPPSGKQNMMNAMQQMNR